VSGHGKIFSMGTQPFSVAMANVNDAMARLRLVVEHRGGTMLPLTEPLTIALCDDRRIEFDTTEDFKLDWWIEGKNPHKRLLALLEQYPSAAEVNRQSAEAVAACALAERIVKLSPEALGFITRYLEDGERAAGIGEGGDKADLVLPVGAVDFDSKTAVGEAPLDPVHPNPPVLSPDATA